MSEEESKDVESVREDIKAMREELDALKIRRELVESHLYDLRAVAAEMYNTHDKVEKMTRQLEEHLAGSDD